ncbi:MAG: TRAP transporter small permease [Polaromonas sp.]|nr:TRAP transporter small permease [Polaromonas sp.]
MKKAMDRLYRWFEHLLVGGLAVMATMVFVNVVLRYVFNTGITFTEEVSRLIFVWLTFIGAIVALRKGTHLGMDTVVSRLPHNGKLVFFVISHLLMLGCCAMLWLGCWEQTRVNLDNYSPVSSIPVAAMYSVGLVTAVLMSITLLANLWLVVTGQITESELVAVRESEEPAAP